MRRIYIVLHGGGKRSRIDARLGEAGLPPLKSEVGGLPKAPVAVIWSTLPAGSPTVPQNRPKHFYPGDEYVDWVGTDFYSDNQDWKALTGLYNRFSNKPFSIPEFGVSVGDDPGYIDRLMIWARRHPRTKMLVYYQDFGSTSAYRIQNYPASLAALSDALHHPIFPPSPPTRRSHPRHPQAVSPQLPKPNANCIKFSIYEDENLMQFGRCPCAGAAAWPLGRLSPGPRRV